MFTFSVEYSSVEYLDHKIIKPCGILCQIDANVSNRILIIRALCDNLEHLRLIRQCVDVSYVRWKMSAPEHLI